VHKGRLEAFSDGVIAVIITIMVLEMKVPHSIELGALAPLSAVIGPLLGDDPNLAETIRASNGVTYWATDAKARRDLDYAPRDLESGLRTLL